MKRAWLKRLFSVLRGGLKATNHRPAGSRPLLECLEDRTLPSGISPYVVSINRTTPVNALTNSSSVGFTVVFSKPVTGVDSTDFRLALTGSTGATLTQVNAVTTSVYTVTVSGVTGNGTLGLDLVDNGRIRDLAGNPLVQGDGTLSFQSPITTEIGPSSRDAILADLNGDGTPDLVITNYSNYSVGVCLGNGDGTFQSENDFAVGGGAIGVAVADVNGDGKPDLIVANLRSNTVSVLLGNGDGTFQSQANFDAGSDPYAVAVADVNGDSRDDIVVTNFTNRGTSGGSVSVLLGNGDGTFQSPAQFATGALPFSVSIQDVNGDGNPDLVVCDDTSPGNVNVLLGNGDGTFEAANTFPITGVSFDAAVADINGDGRPDILVANANYGLSILFGNGDGTFQSPNQLGVGSNVESVALADVNGDGNLDLIAGDVGNSAIDVLAGNGDGSFLNPNVFDIGVAPRSVQVIDINNDGRPDLVATIPDTGVSVLLNTGNGNFVGQAYAIDNVDPFVQSIDRLTPIGPSTNATTVTYNVAFSEAVTGVALNDFGLSLTGTAAGTLTQVTPVSSAVYTVTVSGISGVGTLGLDLIDNGSIRDLAGNPLVQATSSPQFDDNIYSTGVHPRLVVVADVNGDGIPDLITANSGNSSVSVILGNGNGTFQNQTQFFSGGGDPIWVTAADLTADGNTDLVVANLTSASVGVLIGNGNGTFQQAASVLTGPDPSSVTVADVNGDGIPDLVVTNAISSGTVGVLLGNGNGTFQGPTTFIVGSSPYAATLADVNSDGKADLIVANSGTDTVSVLLANGNGTFQRQTTFVTGAGPISLAVTDVTGDGKPDLIVANQDSNSISVLRGNGNGTFQVQTTFATGQYPHSVAVADLNGDGHADLVIANETDDSVSLLLGNGNGTFQHQTAFAAGAEPSAVAVADLGNNSLPDLIVADEGTNALNVFLGTASGGLQNQHIFPAGEYPRSVVSADLNGDGQPDLAVASDTYDGSVSVLLGNRDGSFQRQTTFATGALPDFVTAADVDGDGIADLIVVNNYSGTVSVLLGKGNGTFQSQSTFAVGKYPHSAAAVDFNGDGRPDLVVTNYYDGDVSVLLGNGNGTFQAQQTFNSGSYGAEAIAGADLNGDGVPDLVVSNGGTSTVSVILGNGNGTFQTATTFQTGGYNPKSLAVTDLSGDGIPDIAVANFASVGTVSVLLGNGNGTFEGPTTFAAGSFAASVAAVDVNGDGSPDLAVANYGSGSVSVLIGNGNGTYQQQVTFATGAFPFAMVTGDFNDESRPDLAVVNAGRGSDVATVLLNSENGNFTGQSYTLVQAQPATHFVVSVSSNVTAGAPVDFTVTALDQTNNVSTSYSGIVVFTVSDSAATLTAAATLDDGIGTFSATLITAGSQTLTASDSSNRSITGVASVTVNPASVSRFSVIPSSASATAGNPLVIAVAAEDRFNNVVNSFNGSIQFTSTDSQAVLPNNASLAGGTGYFAAALKTAGNQTITVTNAVSSITGTSVSISVAALPANHFVVTVAPLPMYAGVPAAYPSVPNAASSFATTGNPVSFTVIAADAYGNTDHHYNGTVSFSSSDGASNVALPQLSTLASGTAVFSATLRTPGSQTVTASDTAKPSLSGSSAIVTRGLVVTSFAPNPTGFTVAFDGPFNPSTVDLYTTASLPDDVLLATSGSVVSVRGSLIFNSNDTGFTFIKTDTVTAVGGLNPAAGLLAAGRYTVTLRSYSGGSGFQDAVGDALDGTDSGHPGTNYQITFSVAVPPTAVGIPDFARGPSNTDAVFVGPSVANGSTFALSYANPNVAPATGTATITFSTNSATLQSSIQAALNTGGLTSQVGENSGSIPNAVVVVTNDTSSGANVLVTFQNALATSTSELLTSSTAGVSITTATINLPNSIPGSGIPVALSSGQNVTSGSLTLQYNPSLLSISGAISKIAGASFTVNTTINSGTSATAVLSFSSPSSISANTTAITLGSLLATIPLGATADYGSKQLLHFSSETLNGGAIAVTNQDAVQVDSYFGDATKTGGPLSLLDAQAIATVAGKLANSVAQTIPGFAAFPNLDPLIVGDVTSQGTVSTTDAGVMNQEVGGTAKTPIPYAPSGLPVEPVGPDVLQGVQALAAGSPGLTSAAFLNLSERIDSKAMRKLATIVGHAAESISPTPHPLPSAMPPATSPNGSTAELPSDSGQATLSANETDVIAILAANAQGIWANGQQPHALDRAEQEGLELWVGWLAGWEKEIRDGLEGRPT